MKYDESDNVLVRASRAVTDRVGDTFGKLPYFREHKPHLCTSHTSVQVTPLYKSHLCTSHTSVQVTPLYKSHLCTSRTSVQVAPLYKPHLCTSHTSVQVTPLYKSHLCTSHTSVQVTPLYKSHHGFEQPMISSAIMNYSVHESCPILYQYNLGIKTATYTP